MKNGQSVFLVFLNKDHVFAYKRCKTYSTWQDNSAKCVKLALISNRQTFSPFCRLCMVVSALKGRGVAEVIANARQVSTVTYVCSKRY